MAINTSHSEKKEKHLVAVSSLIAAFFLTAIKVIVGLTTGSLGLLSEALHSGLDLLAAGLTLVAVKISGIPADGDHNYGHGKVENLSALFQTILLFVTCGWIIYEAIERLITGNVHIDVNIWSFAVIIISIIVDISRSRALYKVAKKYNSQALEADALHFSSDILSSLVVLAGLVCALFEFHFADTIAGLIVAFIVIKISIELGKRATNELMDKAPPDIINRVRLIVSEIPEVKIVHNIRARNSGAHTYIDLNIHVPSNFTILEGHNIAQKVENEIMSKIERSNVHVHIEPDEAIHL